LRWARASSRSERSVGEQRLRRRRDQ